MGVSIKKMLRKTIVAATITALLACLFGGGAIKTTDKCKASMTKEATAGYLAVYVAKYEYNMGVEHAQFPSDNYTDNCRTDVLYYALSKDGVNFEGLNNNKPIYYPKGFHQLGSPEVFKKADGSYGLIASINNSSNQIFLADSADLIFFENERVVTLNNDGIIVTNPHVEYSEADAEYAVYWEGGDGKSYKTYTDDFETFSDKEETEYRKNEVEAELPSYALTEEAMIYNLTADEYDRISKKYGKIQSVGINGLNKEINAGEAVTLGDTVEVLYNDGSVANMGVTWDMSNFQYDLSKLPVGTYKINGTIYNEEYNSPLARFRADPYIEYVEEEDMYYLTGSNLNEKSAAGGGAYNSIVLRRAKTINDLTDAEEVEVWTNRTVKMGDNRSDSITGWYWAPELHKIGGKWRIIAMGTLKSTVDGKLERDGWAQCIFTCEGEDLMEPDNWVYNGYIGNGTDNRPVGDFDTTFFEYDGQCYYVTHRGSTLYITTVDAEDLLTPTGPLVEISAPDRAFERNLGSHQDIQEGAGAFIRDGRVFVTYSCATVDMHYGTCLLYADLEDDLMDAESWHKYQAPLLTTADLTTTVTESSLAENPEHTSQTGLIKGEYEGTFGPGHNNFTVDKNGNLVIVYHARDWGDSYPGATGDNKYGLTDPGRHAYVNSVHFGADGFPIFNMTAQQILADELKNVTMTINVVDKNASVNGGNNVINDGNGQNVSDTYNADKTNAVKKGSIHKVGKCKYKVIHAGKRTVEFIGTTSKNIKKLTIPASIKLNGKKYKVTKIAAKACAKNKKLKTVVIKSINISKVGKNAFYKKTIIKVPKAKVKKYKKLFKGCIVKNV